MKRIRLEPEVWDMLAGQAEPGERPQDTLRRLLELRYIKEAYPEGMGLTYKQLAKRWGKSPAFVKQKVGQYRESGGKVGLGPVVKLSARSVVVPWRTISEYEKGGVW